MNLARPFTVEKEPYNAETTREVLLRRQITPNGSFYVRNHFSSPTIDLKSWRLRVTGAVKKPLALSLNEITKMRDKTLVVTLECAGNGRARMQPLPPSTPWLDGAISTASWTGVPLKDLLERAEWEGNAAEVLFRGADMGVEGDRELSYERSLPLSEALHEDVIVAYRMNEKPIPRIHGFPLRVIVPRWYGMASVKWLKEIRFLTEPFQGYYQKERYVYKDAREGHNAVDRIRVKSLILQPAEGAIVRRGRSCSVRGLAWTGYGQITKVEFKTHNSEWRQAGLSENTNNSYAWRHWSIAWKPERLGRFALMSRAYDETGARQPDEPVWNIHGYGYNTVTTRNVSVI